MFSSMSVQSLLCQTKLELEVLLYLLLVVDCGQLPAADDDATTKIATDCP